MKYSRLLSSYFYQNNHSIPITLDRILIEIAVSKRNIKKMTNCIFNDVS